MCFFLTDLTLWLRCCIDFIMRFWLLFTFLFWVLCPCYAPRHLLPRRPQGRLKHATTWETPASSPFANLWSTWSMAPLRCKINCPFRPTGPWLAAAKRRRQTIGGCSSSCSDIIEEPLMESVTSNARPSLALSLWLNLLCLTALLIWTSNQSLSSFQQKFDGTRPWESHCQQSRPVLHECKFGDMITINQHGTKTVMYI